MSDKSKKEFSADNNQLFRLLETQGSKWLCFVQKQREDAIILGASDGVSVWRQSLQNATPTSNDFDIDKLSSAFLEGQLEITCIDDQLTLNLNSKVASRSSAQYQLSKLNITDSQSELKHLLFAVAEKSADLEAKCNRSEKTIESLKRSAASAPSTVFDIRNDAKKKKTQIKMQPKQAGMSIVNPGSKKRTKAKGVEFE